MSVNTGTIDPKYLPNLPGFRPRRVNQGFKRHCFDLIDGEVFIRPKFTAATSPPRSPQETTIDEGSITSIGDSVAGRAKKHFFFNEAPVILHYYAYFEEQNEDSRLPPRVRHVNLYYYIEDGTVKIVEKPQMNSGVIQGTLVKRAVINRGDGMPITEEDLHVGKELSIYGRKVRIDDCDEATRIYLSKRFGNEEVPALTQTIPADPYAKYRQSMEAGALDRWDKFRAKKNENKIFNEAKLGNSVDNSGREGFIKYGNTTLKFRCMWDDTRHLYGDVIEFTLSYYLADDTLEILSIPSAITKEQNRIKLLKRSKLPKDFHTTTGLGVRPAANNFFHWSDFYIGLSLEIYGRLLQIIDADQVTRVFYEDHGYHLGPSIVPPQPEVVVHQREVPPPTGFGSEEDSLRSVAGSLMPGPAPVKKMGENRVLSFLASLLSGGIDDVDRRFVLTFYVLDNTIKVVEPPVRNSGFTGGVFLSRRVVKKGNGEIITDRDLFVGCRLKMLKHEFLLLDTNEGTLRWMEDKGLPRSNIFDVLAKIRPALITDAKNGQLLQQFQAYDSSNNRGQASMETLKTILSAYGLINDLNPDLVTDHELRTILRAAGNRQPTFNYELFISQLISPTNEYK